MIPMDLWSWTSGAAPAPAAVNMVAEQHGYLFYAMCGMRTIVLMALTGLLYA